MLIQALVFLLLGIVKGQSQGGPGQVGNPGDDPGQDPVGDPPVGDPPVNPPVTDPPVVNPPATDPPVVDPPVTDPPVVDPPVTDPPVVDPPVVDPSVVTPPADPDYHTLMKEWVLSIPGEGGFGNDPYNLKQLNDNLEPLVQERLEVVHAIILKLKKDSSANQLLLAKHLRKLYIRNYQLAKLKRELETLHQQINNQTVRVEESDLNVKTLFEMKKKADLSLASRKKHMRIVDDMLTQAKAAAGVDVVADAMPKS